MGLISRVSSRTYSFRDSKMAAQTQNIQKLLQAEKRAQDVISQARVKKQARMKQAKDEAKAEVLAFKAQRESEFKQLEGQVLGDKRQAEANMQTKTDFDIQKIQVRVEQTENAVIDMLSQLVCDVKPVLHKNSSN